MNLAKWLLAAFHNIRVAGHTSTRRPYTGEELRAIRKRNGVGRPPAVRCSGMSQTNAMYNKWIVANLGRLV